MKLPTAYDDDILGYETGAGGTYPDGTPIVAPPTRVYSLVFPPIGFFPFYGHGNGDYHGFYWPIGCEEKPPLVAFSSHDVGALIPEHTDIESLYRCELARCADDEENDDYRQLATEANGRPPVAHDTRSVAHDDFDQLLAFDPTSPFYLCAAGDRHFADNAVELAEQCYRKSLEQIPEYVAAHFGLASVLRRQRRADESTIHLRQALMGPLAFYGGSFWSDSSLPGSFRNEWHRKALMWLQRSKKVHDSLTVDPFIKSIGRLTYESGLAENPDIDVLRTVVDDYANDGQFADAARIWQLLGDRASYETTSFRERYGLNPSTYGSRLAELYDLSENSRRAQLVRNMLRSMDKPDGLYL